MNWHTLLIVPLVTTVRRMIYVKSSDFHFVHNVLLQAHYLTLTLLVAEAVASFTEWMCIGRIMWGPWRRPLPSMATQITVPMLVGEFWMSCSRKPITPTKGICHTDLWSTGFVFQ